MQQINWRMISYGLLLWGLMLLMDLILKIGISAIYDGTLSDKLVNYKIPFIYLPIAFAIAYFRSKKKG